MSYIDQYLIKKDKEENRHCVLNKFLRDSYQLRTAQKETLLSKKSDGVVLKAGPKRHKWLVRPQTTKVRNAKTGDATPSELNADISARDENLDGS